MQNDVYTINATAKLPTLGDRIGKGGNAPVHLCNVTTPSGETLKFACKVEQQVNLYIVQSITTYIIAMYNYRSHCTRTAVCLKKCAVWQIVNTLSLFTHT